MLLFICHGLAPVVHGKSFKYISCYCLSIFSSFVIKSVCVFKYISCYCLSVSSCPLSINNLLFKYISCYCLSRTQDESDVQTAIQIHLMLLFISKIRIYDPKTNLFKYISCYCLSQRQNSTYTVQLYSNTSHVIVYPFSVIQMRKSGKIQIHLMLLFIHPPASLKWRSIRFKYISCYCLSHRTDAFHKILFVFKYISCYCLSFMSLWESSPDSYSNTSHVIVYPSRREIKEEVSEFKYISCYCLSRRNGLDVIHAVKFKYISCYCLSP